MDEQGRTNPDVTNPNKAYGQFNRREDQPERKQGFEREKEDVVLESEENAEELYSGEQTGEIVDPEILHHQRQGSAGLDAETER